MNRKFFILFSTAILVGSFVILNSCKKDPVAATPAQDWSFTQDFDSMIIAQRQGWIAKNNSRPLGTSTWQTGIYAYVTGKTGTTLTGFPAYNTSYSGTDYVFIDFNAQGTPGPGQTGCASAWLISPAVMMKNGDVIGFYTRTAPPDPAGGDYPDRLEFRLNQNNSSANVGYDSSSIGDFTTLGLSVNSNLSHGAYPQDWAPDGHYTYTITGLKTPKMGRFAFRYFVPDAGPSGVNGNGVGIDAVSFDSKL